MVRRGSKVLVGALSSAIVLVGATASAEEAASPPEQQREQQADTTSGGDATETARVHYERGLQLFDEGNYTAALFEFERAYELAPSYRIFYNMGRIQRQQNNYAAAMRSFTRYLREGGDNIPAERRQEVEAELAILKPRVASVSVTVNIDGADVYADDVPVCTATIESSCVGKSPLEAPIILNPGRHKITASKAGYAPATALISVVGSDEVSVKLDLVSYSQPAAPPSNPWTVPTIIGWSATGAAAIAAGVVGVLSMGAKDDQEALLQNPAASHDQLADARDKTQTLSGATDALLISTAVFAGVSSFFTIKMLSSGSKEAQPSPAGAEARRERRPLDVVVSPVGFAAFGTF